MNVLWKTLAAVLLILAGAGVASAGTTVASAGTTLELTFTGDTPALTGTIADTSGGGALNGTFWVGQSNFSLSLTQSPDTGSAAAGLLALAKSLNPENATTGTIYGYCIDTYQTIGAPHLDTWTVVDLNADPTGAPTVGTAAKVNLLKRLFADYSGMAIGSADGAAAMGAAVWEIVNEGGTVGYGLSTGDFQVAGGTGAASAWAMADGWLSTLTELVNDKQMYALVDPDTQDFVIPIGGVGGTPVPEPLTMLTAFMAVSGLGMYIRKRSGKTVLAARPAAEPGVYEETVAPGLNRAKGHSMPSFPKEGSFRDQG